MHAVLSNLARRGMEAHAHLTKEYQPVHEAYKMPAWGIAILVSTAIVYFVTISMMEYTFGRVVPTLVMVESPQAILFDPVASEDPDATLDSKVEPELLLVKQEPITSSFRRTIKHLRANGGYRARFRGAPLFVVYTIALTWMSQWIAAIPFLPAFVAPVVATVILANLSLTWTHVVISERSDKAWYRRVPSVKVWKKVAGPTALLALTEQLVVVLPAILAVFIGLPEVSSGKKMSCAEKQVVMLKGLTVFCVGIAIAIFAVIPANVALTRVQASLLADDQETIVPFDRSFGGKVVPEIVGGTGVVGMLDAWKTFEWSSRVRLVKTYFKLFFMEIALTLFFCLVVVAQIFLIVGPDNLKKIGKNIKASRPAGEVTVS